MTRHSEGASRGELGARAPLRVSPGLLTRELPGGDVVLTTADGATAVILNASAQAVVELCDGTRSLDEVVAFVAELVPDAGLERVEADVTAVVERLRGLGLLEAEPLDAEPLDPERGEPCGSAPSIA